MSSGAKIRLSQVDESAPPLAVIFGVAGESLTPEEAAFFKKANPLGFILFARNCKNPAQVAALTDSLRACLGRDAPVLIDQEGGRVQRLRAPHWTDCPPARHFGSQAEKDLAAGCDAAVVNARMIADDLNSAGFTVNCAPVLDVLAAETHSSLGDRAFSEDPAVVSVLGQAVSRAYLEKGIIPVIKHLPGLGRAHLDTHKDLPAVTADKAALLGRDFAPFQDLLGKTFSEAVWGMVGHAVYEALDERTPASCSRRVIQESIRKDIGFNGLLLSDDLSMEALGQYGDTAARAQMVLRAGCDVALHCNGNLEEMEAVAARIGKMTKEAVMRYNRSVSWIQRNAGNEHRRRAI